MVQGEYLNSRANLSSNGRNSRSANLNTMKSIVGVSRCGAKSKTRETSSCMMMDEQPGDIIVRSVLSDQLTVTSMFPI